MDNQRLLVWAAFGLLSWLTYQQWMLDYGPKTTEPVVSGSEETLSPIVDDDELPALPEASTESSAPELAPELAEQGTVEPAAGLIRVSTDVFELEIDTRGGTIRKATLMNYPVAKDRPDTLIKLLTPEQADLGLIQSGLRARGEGPEANHLATFSSSRYDYELDGEEELVVPLIWSDGQGLTVTKEYRFERGSYVIGLQHRVKNAGDNEGKVSRSSSTPTTL